MFTRDIFSSLEDHLKSRQVTVVTGMRRVGKSTALQYLLEKISGNNKVYFDLEKVDHRYIFNQSSYKDIEIALQIEGLDLESDCYVALDEIQLVPNITSVIKYLYDTYKIKFLVTGSSSFYIKNHFSESLAGRKKIFEMSPLSFSEFLVFKGQITLSIFNETFPRFNISYYNKYKELYREYVTYGGFPEIALEAKISNKTDYLKDIINSYIELDIKLMSDFTKTEELYKLIRLLSARSGSKIDYTKIASLTTLSRHKVKEYIEFLKHTYFIHIIPPFTKNPDREIASQPKIYFADNGLLHALGVTNSGAMIENAVANSLIAKGKLQYYARKTGQEIDFIYNDKIALEVKQTPSVSDFNILKARAKEIGIKESYLLGEQIPQGTFRDFVWTGSI